MRNNYSLLAGRVSFNIALVAFLVFFAPADLFSQRQTILFNDDWKFYKGDPPNANSVEYDDHEWRNVDLPHDWSIEGPFDTAWASATAYLPGGIGWYRKTFSIAPGLHSKHIFLYFDGVYKNSEVWINGHYLGKRPNGFIPFQYEITSYLHSKGKNVVAVKADHTPFADARWYTGSGIYRNVYLIATEAVHIDYRGVFFTSPKVSVHSATANANVSLINQSGKTSSVLVKCKLVDNNGKIAATAQQQLTINANENANAAMSFEVNKPSLWSIDHPALYRLIVTVSLKGIPTDEVADQVGFRSIRFDKDKGFFLNEKNIKLKGVCIHDDAGALGVAVPEEVWARRLKILKEAGCNSLRMSHNPHVDYLYGLADRMGFLVMDEAFDEWEEGKNKWIKGWNVGKPGKDGYHSDFKDWADRDIADMVLRTRNHPSVFLWSIGNEIDYPNDPYTHEVLDSGRNPQIYGRGFMPGNPSAKRLTELATRLVAVVKKYDTTRPVTAALAGVVMSNEVGYPEVLDVVGYNYQEYRYAADHKKYSGRIIYGSENGKELNAWQAVDDNDHISGQYLWTGVDYLGEARSWPSRSNEAGLIDLAGFRKPAYYFRQSLWTDKPMICLVTAGNTGKRGNRRVYTSSWNYKNGDSVRIICYTNCTQAELFLNGKSSGKKQLTDSLKMIVWNIVYEEGELSVKGYNNNVEAASQVVRTAGAAYKVVATPDGGVLNHNKKQVIHIEIGIVDKNGVPLFNADNEVSIKIEGPAELLGMESGSSVSHEDYRSNKRRVFNGRLLAYIRSELYPGPVKIIISSSGLQAATIQFQ